jgi:hypothetical protein
VALELGQGLLLVLECLLLGLPVEMQLMELCLQLARVSAMTRLVAEWYHRTALLGSQWDCLEAAWRTGTSVLPIRARPVIMALALVARFPVVELAAVPRLPQRRGEAEGVLLPVPLALRVLAWAE